MLFYYSLGLLLMITHTINPLLMSQSTEDKTSKLSIRVEGMESGKGSVRVALFDNAKDFTDKPHRVAEQKLNGKKEASLQIADVPYGTYALAVYHDQNANGKLDTNMFGIPKEPYGFSNNYRPSFSKPSFEDASISIQEPELNLKMKVE